MEEDSEKPDHATPDKTVEDASGKEETSDVEIVAVIPESKQQKRKSGRSTPVVLNENDVIVIPDSPEPPEKKMHVRACKSRVIDYRGVKGKSIIKIKSNQQESVKPTQSTLPSMKVCPDTAYLCGSRRDHMSSANPGVSGLMNATESKAMDTEQSTSPPKPSEGESSVESNVNEQTEAGISPAAAERQISSSEARHSKEPLALLDIIIDEDYKDTKTIDQNEASVSSTESNSSQELQVSKPIFTLHLMISKENEAESTVSSTKLCDNEENMSRSSIASIWVGDKRSSIREESSSSCARAYHSSSRAYKSSRSALIEEDLEANVSSTISISSPESGTSKDSAALLDLLVAEETRESEPVARLSDVPSNRSLPESVTSKETQALRDLLVDEEIVGREPEQRESSVASTRSTVEEDITSPKSMSKESFSLTDPDSKGTEFAEARRASTSTRLLGIVQPMSSSESKQSKESIASLDHTYCEENSERLNDNQEFNRSSASLFESSSENRDSVNANEGRSSTSSSSLFETGRSVSVELRNSKRSVALIDQTYVEETEEIETVYQRTFSQSTHRLFDSEQLHSSSETSNESNPPFDRSLEENQEAKHAGERTSSASSPRPCDLEETTSSSSKNSDVSIYVLNETQTKVTEQTGSNVSVFGSFEIEPISSPDSTKSKESSVSIYSNESTLTRNSGDEIDSRFFESDGYFDSENIPKTTRNVTEENNGTLSEEKRFIIYRSNLSDTSDEDEEDNDPNTENNTE